LRPIVASGLRTSKDDQTESAEATNSKEYTSSKKKANHTYMQFRLGSNIQLVLDLFYFNGESPSEEEARVFSPQG